MAFQAQEIKRILEQNGRSANKALGQNFCTDTELLKNAVAAAALSSPVLEIGPGLGALTKELLDNGLSVYAVEKDAFLADLLPSFFPSEKLKVLQQDILLTDISSLLCSRDFSVAGNLPYYITTPILEKILVLLPSVCLFMVQREAAHRFTALPGDRVYGPVSILCSVYYDVQIYADVPRSSYYPQPDVDSRIVLLKRKVIPDSLPPRTFFRFCEKALSKRRKTLLNNFPDCPEFRDILIHCGLPENIRAEAVPPDILKKICLLLESPSDTIRL